MQRTLGRAYQRLRGNHPRRSPSLDGRAMEIVCDCLLAFAALDFLIGLAFTIWSVLSGAGPMSILAGVILVGLGPLLLLLWERLAWEPLASRLSQM